MKILSPVILFMLMFYSSLFSQEAVSYLDTKTLFKLGSKVILKDSSNLNHRVKNSLNAKTPLKLFSKIILVKGSSNITHWESVVKKVDAKLIPLNFKNISTIIDSLFIKIKVTDIRSGRKKMDRLTYKALKASTHPYITFLYTLDTPINSNNQKISGNLTIAGITKKITTQIRFIKNQSTVTLKGTHKLDMTDYGVKPPKAFFGMLRTKKEITIGFTLIFKPSL